MISPWSNLPLDGVKLAVIDTETTGLDLTQDEVVQVAVIHTTLDIGERWIDCTKPHLAFDTLVQPTVVVNDGARNKHGITEAQLDDAPMAGEVAEWLTRALEDRLLVAYNLPFDYCMLRNSFRRHMPLPPFGGLDAYVYGRTLHQSRQLSEMARRYRIPLEDAHDAAADATATALLVPKMLGLVRKEYGPGIFSSVHTLCAWTVWAALKAEQDYYDKQARKKRRPRRMPDRRWAELLR